MGIKRMKTAISEMLIGRAKDMKETVARIMHLDLEIDSIIGSHWVDVRKVRLKMGRLYFVRRVSSCGCLREAVPARWTEGGWHPERDAMPRGECGIGPTTESGATIQVWV